MEILSKYCGNVVQHYQYEKKSLPVKAADLFLLFTVTFPLIGKTHTYHRQERTFTDHRLALFEVRDSVTKAAEVFLRIVCGAATLYLAATSLPFVLLLNAALLTKFASSDNKVIHKQFLEGPKPVLQPVVPTSSLYSNKEYRLDGKVVESLPMSYYQELNKVIRDNGPSTSETKIEEGRKTLRFLRQSGVIQKQHRNDSEKTIDFMVTCQTEGHSVELRYSTNEAQRRYREQLKDEEFNSSEFIVDEVHFQHVPDQYLPKINQMIERYVDSDMLNIEKKMKEGVPVISIRWTHGSIQFLKKGDFYFSRLGVSIDGHHILIKRKHNPKVLSIFSI